MGRLVYVNGHYCDEADAKISIFDRGFLMADGVYEVTSVLKGKLIDFEAHMTRLERSLAELDMQHPCDRATLLDIHRKLVAENQIDEGLIYMQVTRGAADRDFTFPENAAPSLVLFTQKKPLIESTLAKTGMHIITVPDIRWHRRDIKTVQLLAPSLAKMEAKKAGADDAWMIENGFITEGSSNNAYIVSHDNVIITRNLSHDILHGITRASVLEIAARHQLRFEERPFSLEEALSAKEAFITSASAFVMPVVSINAQKINDGKVGPVAQSLRDLYIGKSLETAL